jgi:hypothetical protein
MKEKYEWITIEEAAKRFQTPESIIRGVTQNGSKIPSKKIWSQIVPKGKERFMFRAKNYRSWRKLYRADALKVWCETRNLYMRDKSIAHVAQMDIPKLNIVKGLSLETVSDMHKKNKRLREIHDSYRNSN